MNALRITFCLDIKTYFPWNMQHLHEIKKCQLLGKCQINKSIKHKLNQGNNPTLLELNKCSINFTNNLSTFIYYITFSIIL